ncbi:MAG TPA: hypothetical protein VF628_07335 [Allosphingosinicella sp.]|jgi:hypothetical protein
MGLNKSGLKLAGDMVPRTEPRSAEQRCEPRHEGVVERAILVFRGQDHLVPIVNISSRGTMIQSDLVPRIGEAVTLQFENGVRVQSDIRWVRDGHVGLSFGHQIIFG